MLIFNIFEIVFPKAPINTKKKYTITNAEEFQTPPNFFKVKQIIKQQLTIVLKLTIVDYH